MAVLKDATGETRTPPGPKKKKRPEPEAAPVGVRVEPGVPTNVPRTELPAKLASAERSSRSTLPTDFTYGVAVAATDDKQAARAAAIIAKRVDVPTEALSVVQRSGYTQLIDPLTGDPISLQRARQYLRTSLAAQLAQALGKSDTPYKGIKGRGRYQGGGGPDPAAVERYFTVIDEITPGRVSAEAAVGYSMMAARRDVNLGRFAETMRFITDWNGGSQQLTEEEVIDVSLRWTTTMTRDMTDRDIAAITNPEVFNAVSEARENRVGPGRLPVQTKEREDWARLAISTGDAFGSGKEFEQATRIATQVIADRASRTPGFWERTIAPVLEPVFDEFRFLAHPPEPIQQYIYDPVASTAGAVGRGALEFFDAATNQAMAALYAGGVVLTGGAVHGGVRKGLQDAWAYYMRERRISEDAAEAAGFEPGTPEFAAFSAGYEFVFGWFSDPIVLLGWAAKAKALQRVAGAAGTRFTAGTGIAGRWADPGVLYSEMLDQALSARVPGRWVRAATEGAEGSRFGKSDWDLTDWLMREKNIDRMVDTPRGAYGLGSGLDRRTAFYIRNYVDNIRGGVLDAQTEAGVQDIMRVALGMPARSRTGRWARQAIKENLAGRVARQIDEIVVNAFRSEDLNFGAKGALNYNQQRWIRRRIERELTDLGMPTERAREIAGNATKLRESDLMSPAKIVDRAIIPRSGGGVIPYHSQVGRPTFIPESVDAASELLSREELLTIAGRHPNVATWRDGLAASVEGSQRIIPTIGPFQMLRDARLAFNYSSFWRNRIAERLFHPWFNRIPPAAINLEAGPIAEKAWGEWLHAWKVFSADDIARLRQGFLDAQAVPRVGREEIWRRFIMDTIKEAYTKLGVPDEIVAQLMKVARPRYSHYHEAVNRIYGWLPTKGGALHVDTPILETQLLNTLALPNPYEVRRSIIDAFGSVRSIREKARKMFNAEIEALGPGEQDALIDAISAGRHLKIAAKKYGGAVGEEFTRWLKRLFILRPAWTARVVVLDENSRAMVQLGSMSERLKGLVRKGQTRTIKVAGSDIELAIVPNIPTEASVANILDASRAYASVATQNSAALKRLGIGVLKPGDRTYWKEYERVMNHEVFQDPLGQRILKAFTGDASDGSVITMADAFEWAKQNPRQWALADAAQMDTAEHFRLARDHIMYLVGDNEEVARAVLHGQFDRAVAKANIPDRLPEVAGDLAGEILGTHATLGQQAISKAFEVFGALPSNALNRQPLYRNLFAREAERLLSVASQSGRQFSRTELAAIKRGLSEGPTAADVHPLIRRAHEYAVQETQRVMYTLANRSEFAEARRLLLPFFGPFEEQFTAWSRLAWENPRIIGRAFETGKLAVESGVVKKDEYGQWTLPASFYAPFGIIGDWLGGFEGTDWLPSVAGLNTFWGNTFKIPAGEGSIPLPMPGFNWAFEEFMQAVVPQSWKEEEGWRASIFNYTFAYGDRFSMIPNNYKRLFFAAMPMNSEYLQDVYEDVIRAAAIQGLDIVAENPGEGQITQQQAMRMAREWLAYRGFIGTFLPTYPAIRFEHDEARTEFYNWVDQTGSFDKAEELWKAKYGDGPDSELALIGKRVWAGSGQAIPTTEGVSKLLNDPEFQRVMNHMPELAYFMIPKEVREGEVDLDLYNEQVSAGLRVLRPLGSESVTTGAGPHTYTMNSTIAQHEINQGWEEFFAEDSRFRAAVDAKFPKGIPQDGDPYYGTYRKMLDNHEKIVDQIAQDWPIWGAREAGEINVDDPFYQGNLQMLRNVVTNAPEFRKTAFGQAMSEYFDATEGPDSIRARMAKWNIRNLDTVAARNLGLTGEYKELVEGLREKYGDDFSIPYQTFLEGRHLHDIITSGMKHQMLFTPEYNRIYEDWHTRWLAAGNRIENATGDDRRAAEQRGYLLRQELSIEADAIADRFGDPRLNPQMVWWRDELNRYEREEVKLTTATKPYVFLTSFERREVLGIETSDDVEKAWAAIARNRMQTERAIANDPEHRDGYWDAHNRFVESIVSNTPGMNEEAKRNRDWTYALRTSMPKTWQNGSEGLAWDALFGFSKDLRVAFNKADFVDDDEFQQVQNIMFDYIDELKAYSPHFNDHFDLLEGLGYGPGLIDTFLDPYWYLDF